MFPTYQSLNSVVTKYRFVSNHFELIPTINQMTWSGSIQAWKLPLEISMKSGGASSTDVWTLAGLDACNGNLANQFSGSFVLGCYTACYSSNSTFEFREITNNNTAFPGVIVTNVDFGQFSSPTVLGSQVGIPGLDNGFESMLIKVSGITAAETCLIKTWSCVEYQVSAVSALYEFQSLSPRDPVAYELYKEIINQLPIGVPYEQNEGFWNRVLTIIHSLSGLGTMVPGPFGAVARGTSLISGALLPFTR
jgi:hypothetical protein